MAGNSTYNGHANTIRKQHWLKKGPFTSLSLETLGHVEGLCHLSLRPIQPRKHQLFHTLSLRSGPGSVWQAVLKTKPEPQKDRCVGSLRSDLKEKGTLDWRPLLGASRASVTPCRLVVDQSMRSTLQQNRMLLLGQATSVAIMICIGCLCLQVQVLLPRRYQSPWSAKR